MKYWKQINAALRIWICVFVIALSFLLLGAGRLNDSMNAISQNKEHARTQCSAAALALSPAIPDANRNAWKKMAVEHPELCFRFSCGKLNRVSR